MKRLALLGILAILSLAPHPTLAATSPAPTILSGLYPLNLFPPTSQESNFNIYKYAGYASADCSGAEASLCVYSYATPPNCTDGGPATANLTQPGGASYPFKTSGSIKITVPPNDAQTRPFWGWTQGDKGLVMPAGVTADTANRTLCLSATWNSAGGTTFRANYGAPPTRPNGQSCAAGSECSSGICADSVCCNTACGGSGNDCQACSKAAGAAADGTCGPVANGASCSDGLSCTTGDSCHNGSCGGSVGNCSNATDACHAANTCNGDGTCSFRTRSSSELMGVNSCLIGGACVAGGTVDPANPCQVCDPSRSTSAWSANTGASCSDGNACTQGETCTAQGTCGNAQTTTSCAASDACHSIGSCNPADGTCPAQTLNAGFCFIDGQCIEGGAHLPGDQCRACIPSVSTTGYTVTAGASCTDGTACTAGETCSAQGVCGNPVAVTSCVASDSCHSIAACNPADGTCPPQTLNPGSCFIDGRCIDAGAADPDDQCRACLPSISTSGYSVNQGASCTDANQCAENTACNAQGACEAASTKQCTTDSCHTIGSCEPSTGSCPAAVLNANSCFIGNTCVMAGEFNPANQCQACVPSGSTSSWSPFHVSAPTVTCARTLHVSCAPSAGVACSDANIPEVTATDDCGTPLEVKADPGNAGMCRPGSTFLTWTATDDAGNVGSCTTEVIVDAAPPATISDKMVTLWPPNHKYLSFDLRSCISSVTDSCNQGLTPEAVAASASILAWGSDEPQSVAGSGNTNGDLILRPDNTFLVRPERSGTTNGRVYSIWFQYRNAEGAATTALCQVGVPHDQNSAPFDDGVCHGWFAGSPPADAACLPSLIGKR